MLTTITLLSAAIPLFIIGSLYLFSLDRVAEYWKHPFTNVNMKSIVRSAYGGLFPAYGFLFLLGAFIPSLEFAALVSLLLFMGGFLIGRIVSIMQDGWPAAFIIQLTVIEAVYVVVCGYLLLR